MGVKEGGSNHSHDFLYLTETSIRKFNYQVSEKKKNLTTLKVYYYAVLEKFPDAKNDTIEEFQEKIAYLQYVAEEEQKRLDKAKNGR